MTPELATDTPTPDASKGGRLKGSRTRAKHDVMDVMRADALIALHSIYTNPKERAEDRIDAASFFLLLPRMIGFKEPSQ